MEKFLYDRVKKKTKPISTKSDSVGSPASACGTGRAQSTPSHPGAGVHFPEDEQLSTVIDNNDFEGIDIHETITSQSDTTVPQTENTVVAQQRQSMGGGMLDSRTRVADLATGSHDTAAQDISRRIATLSHNP